MLSMVFGTLFEAMKSKRRLTAVLSEVPGTVTSELQLPGANLVNPATKVQIIVTWIKEVGTVHANKQIKRLDRALKCLNELDKATCKTDMATLFERTEMAKIKHHMYKQCIDFIDVSTQTPPSKEETAPKYHVEYVFQYAIHRFIRTK